MSVTNSFSPLSDQNLLPLILLNLDPKNLHHIKLVCKLWSESISKITPLVYLRHNNLLLHAQLFQLKSYTKENQLVFRDKKTRQELSSPTMLAALNYKQSNLDTSGIAPIQIAQAYHLDVDPLMKPKEFTLFDLEISTKTNELVLGKSLCVRTGSELWAFTKNLNAFSFKVISSTDYQATISFSFNNLGLTES